MRSIKLLFEETKNDLEINNKYIKNTSLLPPFHCPELGSSKHKEDIDTVKHYYHNQTLDKDFLKVAHKSCKKIFKKFCKQNNLSVDWKLIKDILSDVENITFKLKRKFNRPRPKELLVKEDNDYKNIYDMGSPSFPSGHTTTAYFISELLSHFYPEEKHNFKTIAELIGQSRIENAVHYPTDVLYGKLLGEMLANIFLDEHAQNMFNDVLKIDVDRKDEKKTAEYLRSIAFKNSGESETSLKKFANDLGEFIHISNKIENVNLKINDCCSASLKFLRGYPIKFKDKNINSFFKMLCIAHKLKDIKSPYCPILIHKFLDASLLKKGKPGMLRDTNGHSKYGNAYSSPDDIFIHMKKLSDISNPFVKHIIFELIHPFCDGNGRTGRIILLSDLDYDINQINNFCDRNYFKRIENAIDKYGNIKKLLG